MKKAFTVILCVLLTMSLVLSLAACKPEEPEKNQENIFDKVPNQRPDYDAEDVQSILDALAARFVTSTEFIAGNMQTLKNVLGYNYATYQENSYVVPDFYKNLQKVSDGLYASVERISYDYFILMAKSGKGDHENWESATAEYWAIWEAGITAYGKTWQGAAEEVYDVCGDLIATILQTENKDGYSTLWTPMYAAYLNTTYSMQRDYVVAEAVGRINYESIVEGFNAGNMDVDAILDEAAEVEIPEVTEPSETTQPSTEENDNQGGFISECIEVLNNYEAFVVRYCEFMKEYLAAKDTSALEKKQEEYAAEMKQYELALSYWTEDTMTEYEFFYYEGVMYRCDALLSEIE